MSKLDRKLVIGVYFDLFTYANFRNQNIKRDQIEDPDFIIDIKPFKGVHNNISIYKSLLVDLGLKDYTDSHRLILDELPLHKLNELKMHLL